MASGRKTVVIGDGSVKMTTREFAFADAILRGLQNIDAVVEAGFQCKTRVACSVMATHLLKNPSIQQYISHETQARALARRKAIEVDDLWITEQFKEIYNRCMQRIPVMKFDREAGAMVQETDDNGEGVWTFDSSGANRALENIAKHIGYFELDNRQRAPVIKVNIQRNNIQINNHTEGTKEDAGT